MNTTSGCKKEKEGLKIENEVKRSRRNRIPLLPDTLKIVGLNQFHRCAWSLGEHYRFVNGFLMDWVRKFAARAKKFWTFVLIACMV